MRALVVGVGLAALAVPAWTLGSAEAHPTQTRVVDRTFSCATEAVGGGRHDLDVVAAPRAVHPTETIPANLGLSSGTNTLDSELVVARAAPLLRIDRTLPAGVYAHARRCVPSRAAAPLSAQGIGGAPVRWFKALECVVPGRVLVRVRAVLERTTAWRGGAVYAGARGAVKDASVAVRIARSGQPLLFMKLTGGVRTALWYSGSCS